MSLIGVLAVCMPEVKTPLPPRPPIHVCFFPEEHFHVAFRSLVGCAKFECMSLTRGDQILVSLPLIAVRIIILKLITQARRCKHVRMMRSSKDGGSICHTIPDIIDQKNVLITPFVVVPSINTTTRTTFPLLQVMSAVSPYNATTITYVQPTGLWK